MSFPSDKQPLLYSILNPFALVDKKTLINDFRALTVPCDDKTNFTHDDYHFIRYGKNITPLSIATTNNPKDTAKIANTLQALLRQASEGLMIDIHLCKALFIFEKPNCFGALFSRFTNCAATEQYTNQQFETDPTGHPKIYYEIIQGNMNQIKVCYEQQLTGLQSSFAEDETYQSQVKLQISFTLAMQNNQVHMTDAAAILYTDPASSIKFTPMLKAIYKANKDLFAQRYNNASVISYFDSMWVSLGLASVAERLVYYPLLPAPEMGSCCTIL